MIYKRANKLVATLYFFFARQKYLHLAESHGMAINLEAADLRQAYENGTFPSDEGKEYAKIKHKEFASHLQTKLVHSFSYITLASVVALFIGFSLGEIHLLYSFNHSKVVIFVGTYLASWGTLFELGGGIATMSGEALHEIIHPVIFQLLFIPGVLLMLTGIAI